jgi:hypothetical protein
VLQRLTLDVLHDDQHRLAVGVDVEDRHQVRMVQRCAEPGLALEALRGVLRTVRVELLDRHLAPQALVLGQVDLGHPPDADRVELPVATGQQLVLRLKRHPPAVPVRVTGKTAYRGVRSAR